MSTPSPNSERNQLNAALIILTCFSTTVLSSFSVSGPSIALPSIGRDINLSQAELQWICSAFALSSGCFLLLFGRLADIHGRKVVFLIGTALTGLFSLACGFARTKIQLIVFRAFQGMGSAASIPAALGILAHSFQPSPRRSVAFSVFSAGNPFGSGLGYILGALAGQYSSIKWRAIFFIGFGISFISFIGALLVFENDRIRLGKEGNQKVDWLGAFFITTGLALILFVFSQDGNSSPWMILILVLGLIQVILFVLCEYSLAKHYHSAADRPPLMSLDLWSRAKGKFAAIQFIAFFEWCAFMSWMIWVQLYYQLYKEYTPVQTMLRLLPMCITGFILNIIISFIVSRIDVLWLLIVGTLSTGLGCLLFAIIIPSAPYWAFGFPASILSVWGVDIIFACGTLFVARVARSGEESVAGGVFQSVAQLGKAFGLAASTSIYKSFASSSYSQSQTSTAPTTKPPLNAFQAAQWTGFIFAIASLIFAILFFRNVGVVGHSSRPKPSQKSHSESDSIELGPQYELELCRTQTTQSQHASKSNSHAASSSNFNPSSGSLTYKVHSDASTFTLCDAEFEAQLELDENPNKQPQSESESEVLHRARYSVSCETLTDPDYIDTEHNKSSVKTSV